MNKQQSQWLTKRKELEKAHKAILARQAEGKPVDLWDLAFARLWVKLNPK